MRTFSLAILLAVACSSPRSNQPSPTPPPGDEPAPPPGEQPPAPPGEQPPAIVPPDAASAPPPQGGLRYFSDCSLTHPIARDPCQGTPAGTRGLQSCAGKGIAIGQACGAGAPDCYVEQACSDGRKVVADYLVCAAERPGRCFTRSSRRYKDDVSYVSAADRRELARQIETLPLARFRYRDSAPGTRRLGFITEDAPGSEFVSDAGRTVDLYALLAASIAAIQSQDERIRALESQLRQCQPQRR
jgi:hypothetical protein